MTDLDKMAKSLTKAQREAVLKVACILDAAADEVVRVEIEMQDGNFVTAFADDLVNDLVEAFGIELECRPAPLFSALRKHLEKNDG